MNTQLDEIYKYVQAVLFVPSMILEEHSPVSSFRRGTSKLRRTCITDRQGTLEVRKVGNKYHISASYEGYLTAQKYFAIIDPSDDDFQVKLKQYAREASWALVRQEKYLGSQQPKHLAMDTVSGILFASRSENRYEVKNENDSQRCLVSIGTLATSPFDSALIVFTHEGDILRLMIRMVGCHKPFYEMVTSGDLSEEDWVAIAWDALGHVEAEVRVK